MSDYGYVLTDYETALRQRRAAREAAYQAYKARRIAIQAQRVRDDMLAQIMREDADYEKRRAMRPFPARLMSREEFYNPDN